MYSEELISHPELQPLIKKFKMNYTVIFDGEKINSDIKTTPIKV